MASEDTKEIQQRLKKKTSLMIFVFLFAFGVPAVIGALIGNYIDDQLGFAPFGSLGILFISYIISWVVALRTYRYIKKHDSLTVIEEENE